MKADGVSFQEPLTEWGVFFFSPAVASPRFSLLFNLLEFEFFSDLLNR
jgi:hypothetical protein